MRRTPLPAVKITICDCGREKHLYALHCQHCYNRRWTEDDDGLLRAMFAEGVPQKLMGEVLERSANAVRSRAAKIGLKVSWEVHQRNRIAAMREFWANPENVTAKRAEWEKSYGHRRQELSLRARERNLAGQFGLGGKGHSPATRKKMSASQLRAADRRLNFAPRGDPLRKEYERLVRRRGMAKAAAVVQESVDARKLRAVMATDAARRALLDTEAAPASRAALWCDQCERLRQPDEIAACQSPFCAVKQAIAA